jgi:UDP-galactopyranose mutase
MEYDYLIVGSGLFGSVFAREMTDKGKKCLVIERRDHIGGNVYTKEDHGINVHMYGAHIFHTDNKEVWEYVNNMLILTVLQTHLLQTIRVNYIIFLST